MSEDQPATDVAASPGEHVQRANPWVTALMSIGAIVAPIGLIILIVGVANNANYSSASDDSGIGELYLGSSLFGVGVLVLVAGFIVAGFEWSLRALARKDAA